MKYLNLLFVLLLFSCSTEEQQDDSRDSTTADIGPTDTQVLQVQGYSNYDLVGFNILLENKALEIDESLALEAIDLLESKLLEISTLYLDPVILNQLTTVNIFVDWNTSNGAAVFHPSAIWLSQNGYITEKEGAIEISNITNFINWTNQNQPYMVLHELAHGYHHNMTNGGEKKAAITSAYQNALNTNLYTDVDYNVGNGNFVTAPEAYALTSEGEYFAELTEAFFGLNDYYPFDKDDLERYDSAGFNMMKFAWEQE
ncbi:MAG: hypothetical protein AAF717_12570 [Bacteroidota bacterium]